MVKTASMRRSRVVHRLLLELLLVLPPPLLELVVNDIGGCSLSFVHCFGVCKQTPSLRVVLSSRFTSLTPETETSPFFCSYLDIYDCFSLFKRFGTFLFDRVTFFAPVVESALQYITTSLGVSVLLVNTICSRCLVVAHAAQSF